VAEAAVVGVPDRFWGEVVGAVVRRVPERSPGNSSGTSPERSPSQADLAGYCRERLAGFKVPVRWLFTDAFPLTSTGKVRKDVLSAQFTSPAGVGGPRST
jgi:fatty-acyl-CoA synthase